jgi:hypothetical protein
VITYNIDVYSDDILTQDEIKAAQSAAYLAYQVSIGSFEILEMGYNRYRNDMIIEVTSTLVMKVVLNASQSTYTTYGGDGQFVTEIASSLNINESSVAIVSSDVTDDEYMEVVYSIDIYSDDILTEALLK